MPDNLTRRFKIMKIIKAYTQQEIDDGNTIPSYNVSWTNPKTGRRTGNSWRSLRRAKQVYNRKLLEGAEPVIKEKRIAGSLYAGPGGLEFR